MTWNGISCHEKYIKNRIVTPFASMVCESPFYSMTIYATPCDGKPECRGHLDELACNDNVKTNIILCVSSALVLVLFIGLTFYYYLTEQKSSCNRNIPEPTSHVNMLIKYSKNHDDQQIVKEVNLHLLHSLNTQTVEDTKKTLIDFFNLEIEKHSCEAEVYLCIHQKLDP